MDAPNLRPSRPFFLKQIPSSLLACLVAVCAQTSQAEPLFPNSVVSNDIDFIHTDDPTVAYKLIDEGRSRQEMPSSLTSKDLWQDDAYVFAINYEDGATVAVFADEGFDTAEIAKGYTTKIANALGKLPLPLRTKLDRVILHQGDRAATSEHIGHFIMLYAENIDKRVSTHDLEETVFHEMMHASLEFGHALSDEWVAAQEADGDFITTYAAKNPEQEDLPESGLFAYTLINHPGRMPAEVEAGVKRIMPNRLEYLRAVFADLETAVKKRPLTRERVSMPMDYLRQSDPGIAFSVKNVGRERLEYIADDKAKFGPVLLLKLAFEDGIDVEVQVSPEIKDDGRAIASARTLAESLCRMPAWMRRSLANIRLEPRGEAFGAEPGGRFILASVQLIEREATNPEFDEDLFLAVAKAAFDYEHGGDQAWLTSQDRDPLSFMHPTDNWRAPLLAETMLVAHVLNTYPDRIPADAGAAIRAAIPNRLRYVERLVQSLEAE